MVATRRGVRVLSPAKSSQEQPSDVQATPSTGRITRRTARQAENDGQHTLAEACVLLKRSEVEGPTSPATSLPKRCSRASRLHSPEQPCTPVGSTHEGDVSDVESCCSAESVPLTLTRSRRKQVRVLSQDEDLSEVESCNSAVSPPNTGRRTRRSTRNLVSADLADSKADESCNPAVTRSQRKSARTRSAAKQQQQQQTGDSELSDTDSFLSSASASASTRRRATRSRKQTGSIPIHLDEAAESSTPSTPTRRSSRATTRGRSAASASDPQSCDSEGFEFGPGHSVRRGGKSRALDSDSEPSLVGSPCSTRGRGTPCSSRTGSGSSSRDAPGVRRSARQLGIVQEKSVELVEEDAATLDDSQLENTVIGEDAECTLVEEEEEEVKDQGERVEEGDVCVSSQERAVCVSEETEKAPCAEEVDKPAAVDNAQQGELCEDNEEQSSPEMEGTQETSSASEKAEPPMASAAASRESPGNVQDLEAADVEENAAGEEEDVEMVVSASPGNSHQAVESSEDIQVTSSQQAAVTVESSPERQPADAVTGQTKKVISLLDSSEDEEEGEDEEKGEDEEGEEEEEEKELSEAETPGPSGKSETACTRMGGMFMIDTRPGQDADEDYYMTKEAKGDKAEPEEKEEEEEEEEEDEFVDEEEEEDDETANMLYSSRNPLVKEMSSRIDPGIRVKELGGLYINFDGSKSKPVSSSLQKLKEKKIQDEVMKKSVIGPDFEKKDSVPPYKESKHALKLKHREEKAKTTGEAWFNMKAPELNKELKGDLQVLKMRGSLDTKRFYKKNDRDGFPKYFQVGTVVDNPVDFYHSRVPKKARKRTMVEELLADAEFRQNNKRKYQQVVAEQAAQRAGKKIKKKINNKMGKK
ncbi:deoxynucleotidyltransferase terminal-interacting protein 2 [Nelusetta ayraudi]|uniref:deoxynucleotidyltransferase terminal-interacting protein 2 n=1 Tax=Nelusetta ayraudi TaxID=303726 RepID=UPI003F714124